MICLGSRAPLAGLSSFKDDSSPDTWDYSGFVRVYAAYLDEKVRVASALGCVRRRRLHRPQCNSRTNHCTCTFEAGPAPESTMTRYGMSELSK